MNSTSFCFPLMYRAARFVEGAVNPDFNTVEVIWTTGATVRRRMLYPHAHAMEFDEQLLVDPTSVRLDSMNSGAAPFLNSHRIQLDSILGTVVPGTARLAGGAGYATIRLSRAASDADIVQKIQDQIIRHVSIGYRLHKVDIVQRNGNVPLHRVVDWEPLEISAVAVPADRGAHLQSR